MGSNKTGDIIKELKYCLGARVILKYDENTSGGLFNGIKAIVHQHIGHDTKHTHMGRLYVDFNHLNACNRIEK